MIYIRIFIIFLLPLSLFSSTDILKTSEVFIDKNATYTIDTIHNAKFEPFDKYAYPYSKISKIHRGYTDETLWIKFTIMNKTMKNIQKVLVVDNHMLDKITLFTSTNHLFKSETVGVLNNRNFDEKILQFYFNIDLEPQESKSYYLQVSSISSAVYFSLQLIEKKQLLVNEIIHQIILGSFFSAITILVIYNLFIFFFTKEISYFYYSMYIFLTTWNHISYTSFGLYLLPVGFEKVDAYFTIYYLCLTVIFAILFSKEFINLKKYKVLNFLATLVIVISLFFILITSKSFYPLGLVSFTLLLALTFILLVSYYLFYKKEPNAKYFIIGWSIAIFGWLMLGNRQFGYWTLLDIYPYFYELTVLLEAILFSIALSAKINKTKELEISVQKSEILTKELHHRVKNNMQFIISMYRLKLSKYMDEKLSSILNEIELTIQAMSATHEMLYSKTNLAKIDTKEYFESLIERISKSFDLKEIKVKTDIDTKLGIDASITLGIILNELITNSLKYAFKEGKGIISIQLYKKDKNYKFIYRDNGIGFDTVDHTKSFGTRIITNLVNDDLKGTIEHVSHKGIVYTISWGN